MTDLFNQLGGDLTEFKMRNIDSAGLHEIIGEFAPLLGVATETITVPKKKIKVEPEELNDKTAVDVKLVVQSEIVGSYDSESLQKQADSDSRAVRSETALDLTLKPKVETAVLYPGELENPPFEYIPILPLKRELSESMIDQSVYKKSRQSLDSQILESKLYINPADLHNESSSVSCQTANIDSDDEGIKTSNLLYEVKVVNDLKYYQCKICPKVYDTKYHLNRHLISHGGNRPHCCDQCGRSFSQKCDLNRHMNVHNNVRKHACSVCGKSFKRGDYLSKHERQYCGVYKPHKCGKCHKGFEDVQTLNEHSCAQRVDGTVFSCETCEEKFTTVDSLVEHRKTHNNQKHEYQCTRCKEEFNTFISYVDHFKKHSGERPYTCDLCQKIFTRNHNLMTHMWIHNQEKQHTCHICAKTFTYYSNLQVHLRVHRNERPYKCLQCNKGFLTSSDLRRHQRTHSGEKPYKCEQCNAKYARKERLIGHMITHMEEGLENRDSLSEEASKDSFDSATSNHLTNGSKNPDTNTSSNIVCEEKDLTATSKQKKYLIKMDLPDSDFTAEYIVVKEEMDSEEDD